MISIINCVCLCSWGNFCFFFSGSDCFFTLFLFVNVELISLIFVWFGILARMSLSALKKRKFWMISIDLVCCPVS